MHAQEILATHPQAAPDANGQLAACIEACLDCAQVCTVCADACLGEEMVADLVQCIRTDLDCADICTATAAIAARRSSESILRDVLTACEGACRTCAEECERHAKMHDHCRICAEVCRRCEQSCRQALRTFH